MDAQAKPAQDALLAIAGEHPEATLREIQKLELPAHHAVRPNNVDMKRLAAVLAVAHEREFQDFASLLLLENLGPRTLQSLALVAEVVHGTPARFSDPARFSFALGGKDRQPFPVPLKTYDETISVLRHGLEDARLGNSEKTGGLRRLDRFVQFVNERYAPDASFADVIKHEHSISASLGGRSVFDDRRKSVSSGRQLALF